MENDIYYLQTVTLEADEIHGLLYYLAKYHNGLRQIEKKFDANEVAHIPTQIES